VQVWPANSERVSSGQSDQVRSLATGADHPVEMNDKVIPMALPPYRKALSPKVLGALALVCLVLSIAFSILAIFVPALFENEIARFMLCVSTATLLAVFFFIFYPEKVQTNLPLVTGIGLRVAGPIALWLGVFLLLLHYAPEPQSGRLFEITPAGMYLGDQSTTYFFPKEGPKPDQWLVGANDNSRLLYGIYVVFPINVRKIDGFLHHDGWSNNVKVTLSRDGPPTIDVSSAR
jgi:hypothetical protein